MSSCCYAETMEREPLNDTWGNPQYVVKDDNGKRVGSATTNPLPDTWGNKTIDVDYDKEE